LGVSAPAYVRPDGRVAVVTVPGLSPAGTGHGRRYGRNGRGDGMPGRHAGCGAVR
jgi:hypothetical protein